MTGIRYRVHLALSILVKLWRERFLGAACGWT